MALSDLCTLSDVRAAWQVQTTDTTRDALIATLITAASSSIMRYCDREFAPATASATRRFHLEAYDAALVVDLAPYDLRSASAVTLNPEASGPVTLTLDVDYTLLPKPSRDGVYNRISIQPFLPVFSSYALHFGQPQVDVAGAWGFASVPVDVNMACVRTVLSWLDRSLQAYGGQDVLLEDPRLQYAGSVDSAYGIPAGAIRLLQGYRRWTP